jgi:3-hydroxyacyl-CoA dehydrogenase / 3-hydroxy-2-methylbutyryl-CoA dehydrogenase
MFPISQCVAYITGAGQGLGKATAIRLSSLGAKVVLCDISESAVTALAHQIGLESAIPVTVDVTNEEQVARSIDNAMKRFGKINVNVNCAGIAPPMRVLGKKGPHNLDQFIKVIHVNTIGTFNVLRLVSEQMAKNTPDSDGVRGVIINTASVAAMDGQIGQAAYAASKGAVVAMTLPIARELAGSGIRVMTIAPGLFMTPMMEGLPESVQKDLAATVPLPNRLGQPDEYAKLVEAIIGNNMLNGEVIRLDGALRMQAK